MHMRYTLVLDARAALKANGYADNHVMLTEDRRWGDSLSEPVLARRAQPDGSMADHGCRRTRQRLDDREAAPRQAAPTWWMRAGRAMTTPQKIVETATYGSGRCERLYPANSFPRGVAGAPIAAPTSSSASSSRSSASDYKVTLHGGRDGAAEEDIPGRRLRLVEARRGAAAPDRELADVQRSDRVAGGVGPIKKAAGAEAQPSVTRP